MKKVLALILSVLLLVAGLPFAAFAVDTVPGSVEELDGKYYSIGEVLYENDFEDEAVDTLPAGWEAGTTGYIWANNSSGVSAKVATSSNGQKKLSVGMSGTDGLVFSPVINTRNYVFEADVTYSGNQYIGITNNMSGGISNSKAVVINRVAMKDGTSYSATFSKASAGVSGIAEQKFTINSPVVGETFKVKIISFEGKSYFYYNGELVSTYSNIRTEEATDCVGLFGCNSWGSIDNVVIKALNVEEAPPVKTAAEKYAENTLGAELGDILLEEDFSKGSMSAAVSGNHAISSDYTKASGWEFFDTGAGVWHANAGSCIIKGGYLNFYCSYGDSAVLLPQLNTSDYIFTAKIRREGWGHATSGAMALVTDVANDAANTTTFQRFSANFNGAAEPHTLTTAFVKNNSKTTNYTLTGTYDMANYVDFTVISFKGMKYFFIEEELVATAASILNEGERIGFYISTKSIAVDDVVVKKLNTPPPAEEKYAATLGAEIGEVLLEEHFDKGDMAKVSGNTTISSDYTQMPGWEFVDTAPFIWHANTASVRIINGAANFWCSNGNAALILPQLNESNYIFTAKIKRGGWGATGASAGILTDLSADLSSDKPQLRFIGYYDSSTDDGAFPFTKVITRANGTERELTLENTYDMVSYIDFGVVSYEGTNYYFLNGDYVGSAAKVGGEGERLGFYLGTADIYVDDVYVKALNVPFESELTDVYGMNAIKVGTVSDNQTYKVDFEYIAENNFNVGFFTADADNANSVGYVEGANVSVYTAEASADVATATTYLTVDKKGGKDDAIGSDLYMYVIGDAEGVEIANATATMLTDVTGENALVANGGVSILEGVAENKSQAMRYYFTYDTTTGSDIVIDGETYTVKSRGFLVANGNVNGGAQITRSSANGTSIKDINSTNLNKCWDAKANGDALNSTELTYSMYVTGFKAVNGTYNNTNRLYVKGYIVVEIDGVEYTLYGEETNATVSEVAAVN